jgi:hypothetical protein
MTVTLTREEAQHVLDALEGSIDAQEWEINDHITKYGEWFRPQRIESMKRQLADANSTIDLLRARLSASEPLCKTGSQCIGGKCPQCVVTEPVGWIYEDDEGRMMFSQMPTSALFWEPVYRGKQEKNT